MKFKNSKLLTYSLIGLIILMPSALAFELPDLFENIVDIFSNPEIVSVAAFFLLFILQYGIIATALGFVKIFGEGGTISKNGKTVAIAISLLGTLGIFGYAQATGGYVDFVESAFSVLELFGTIAAWLLGIFISLITFMTYQKVPTENKSYNWCKRIGLGLFSFGLTLYIVGSLLTQEDNTELGLAMITMGVVTYIIGSFMKSGWTSEQRRSHLDNLRDTDRLQQQEAAIHQARAQRDAGARLANGEAGSNNNDANSNAEGSYIQQLKLILKNMLENANLIDTDFNSLESLLSEYPSQLNTAREARGELDRSRESLENTRNNISEDE